jgi:hypothetical protein
MNKPDGPARIHTLEQANNILAGADRARASIIRKLTSCRPRDFGKRVDHILGGLRAVGKDQDDAYTFIRAWCARREVGK